MIRNWNEHSLYMDFSEMATDSHPQPSDIDMFYLGANNTLILGEIKNERGELKDGQRRLLERLADGWRGNSMVLYITHDKYVQKGDKKVNVAQCFVQKYYWKKKWRTPLTPTRVYEVIDQFSKKK